MQTRREFLKTAGAMAAAVAVRPSLLPAAEAEWSPVVGEWYSVLATYRDGVFASGWINGECRSEADIAKLVRVRLIEADRFTDSTISVFVRHTEPPENPVVDEWELWCGVFDESEHREFWKYSQEKLAALSSGRPDVICHWGEISDVQFFDTALSDNEIGQLYASPFRE